MVSTFQVLVGATLLLTGGLVAGSVAIYRRFPTWIPRAETSLSDRGFRFVRLALPGAALIGALGAIVETLQTAGTVLLVDAEDPGALGSLAASLPPLLGQTMLDFGVSVLLTVGVYVVVVEVRAWLQ